MRTSFALLISLLGGCALFPAGIFSRPQAKTTTCNTLTLPFNGAVLPTQGNAQYGAQREMGNHAGIDFIDTESKPVHAVRGGKRDIFVGTSPEGGDCLSIIVDAYRGETDVYCGFEYRNPATTTMTVKAGDVLGFPHRRPDGKYIFHFGAEKWNGKDGFQSIDPTAILRQANGCK